MHPRFFNTNVSSIAEHPNHARFGQPDETMVPIQARIGFIAMPPALRCLLLQRMALSATTTRHITTTAPARATYTTAPHSSSFHPIDDPILDDFEDYGDDYEDSYDRLSLPPRRPSPQPEGPTLATLFAASQAFVAFHPRPSNDPNQIPIASVRPPNAALCAANKIFTLKKPFFLHSSPDFKRLPSNTYTPEVLLLGSSNVGKSTLLNALGGTLPHEAGRSHGLQARRGNLALTSHRAGCTKTLNMFGFGEAPTEVVQAALEVRAEENKKAGSLSRKERREHAKRPREKLPWNTLVLVDTPGYGFQSLEEWGVEVWKYLNGRKMLKGAVVLIDAVAGVKKNDWAVLRMLKNANVKTMVVVTKADKVQYAIDDVNNVLNKIWKTLREVEATWTPEDAMWTTPKIVKEAEELGTPWQEGHGWERETWVTGAGDPRKNGGMGVDGVRFGICKLAGLVADERKLAPIVPKQAKEAEPVKIVPFDQITWAPAAKEPTVAEEKDNAPAATKRANNAGAKKNMTFEEILLAAAINEPTEGKGKNGWEEAKSFGMGVKKTKPVPTPSKRAKKGNPELTATFEEVLMASAVGVSDAIKGRKRRGKEDQGEVNKMF
jgi:GTP-binding protein